MTRMTSPPAGRRRPAGVYNPARVPGLFDIVPTLLLCAPVLMLELLRGALWMCMRLLGTAADIVDACIVLLQQLFNAICRLDRRLASLCS